jgi:broad specificity phosphatase PhoE
MPVILLVRHGQASFGEADYDRLSELGRRQSRAAGRELARRSLRDPVVVSGSLRRQRDTAAIALAEADLPVEVAIDARWDEYNHADLFKHLSDFTPATAPTSSRDFQKVLDDALLHWVSEGSETGWGAFSGGARAALDQVIAAAGRGRDALVFTSGGVIAALCAELLDGGAKTVVKLNRVAVNSGMTKLLVGASGISLSSYNDHAHLDRADITLR